MLTVEPNTKAAYRKHDSTDMNMRNILPKAQSTHISSATFGVGRCILRQNLQRSDHAFPACAAAGMCLTGTPPCPSGWVMVFLPWGGLASLPDREKAIYGDFSSLASGWRDGTEKVQILYWCPISQDFFFNFGGFSSDPVCSHIKSYQTRFRRSVERKTPAF